MHTSEAHSLDNQGRQYIISSGEVQYLHANTFLWIFGSLLACLHFSLKFIIVYILTYLNAMYVKSKGDPRNAKGRKEVGEKMRKLQ